MNQEQNSEQSKAKHQPQEPKEKSEQEQKKEINQPKDIKEKKELSEKEISKDSSDKDEFFNVITVNMKSNISAILLSCEKIIQAQNGKEIHLMATGNSIFKLVTIAEILKNLYPSLIHNTNLSTHSSKNIQLEIVISQKEPEGKIVEKISDEKKNELIKIWQNQKYGKNVVKNNSNNPAINRYNNDRRTVGRRFLVPQNRGVGFVNRGGFINGYGNIPNRFYGNGMIRNRWNGNIMGIGNRWQGNGIIINRNWRNNNNGNWNNWVPNWNNRRFMFSN